MTPLVLFMLVAMARSQETTPDYTPCSQDTDCQTEDCPDAWCNDSGSCGFPWIEGCKPIDDGCLPYDGSVVPDTECSKYSDTMMKEPIYFEHSSSNLDI